jgi:ABC-2 type transport system ATP-binding protein
MSSVLVADNATKRYGEVLGLNGFSANLAPGITALIGPNGAGKSTLFRLVIGQLKLDSGSLSVLDRPVDADSAMYREIGYCPENPSVYGWMTPFEFVSYLLRIDGFPRSEAHARATRSLHQVGLTSVSHRPLRGFSKGMRQRVKVAQAMSHDPRMLLLDEPLNGLDPVGRVEMMDLFRQLAAEGRHLLVSSHVLYEVERLTEQVVIIANGRAVAEGAIHQLREAIDAHPHSVFLRTPEPRRLATLLARWDHVTALEFPEPDAVVARTRAPEEFYRSIPELVVNERVPVLEMHSPDDNLEAVFRFLAE